MYPLQPKLTLDGTSISDHHVFPTSSHQLRPHLNSLGSWSPFILPSFQIIEKIAKNRKHSSSSKPLQPLLSSSPHTDSGRSPELFPSDTSQLHLVPRNPAMVNTGISDARSTTDYPTLAASDLTPINLIQPSSSHQRIFPQPPPGFSLPLSHWYHPILLPQVGLPPSASIPNGKEYNPNLVSTSCSPSRSISNDGVGIPSCFGNQSKISNVLPSQGEGVGEHHVDPMPTPASVIQSEFHTPRCNTFFDSDVDFPQSLPPLEGHVDCSLVREVVWEEWAHRRVTKMVEKETQLTPQKSRHCGIPFQLRHEVVRWLLEFELCIKHYPPISPPTRHRAITMFSTFWSKRGLPQNLSPGDARLVACRSGVACMVLACKADIDVFQPLFVLSLNIWVSRVVDSGWIPVDVNCLAAYERTILRELSYETTKATPFDLVSELSIASPELETLMSHCGEDWELIEETFGIILEQSVQNQGYLQFRTSVMAAAALFLSMEGCLFDHPLDQMATQGRHWVRDSDGSWHKTIDRSSPNSVRVKIVSEVMSNNHLIEVVEEDIKASIILLMDLNENEVEQCKDWCAAL